VLTHVDFARLYVENHMAKFNAFGDHCDASAVLSLLIVFFTAAVQMAAANVRKARNDWAHCGFSKWDQAKFQQSFNEMEHLVKAMALPAADEGKLLGELKDWETKGISCKPKFDHKQWWLHWAKTYTKMYPSFFQEKIQLSEFLSCEFFLISIFSCYMCLIVLPVCTEEATESCKF